MSIPPTQTLDPLTQVAGENTVVVVPGVGHFELEHSSHDGAVAALVLRWLEPILEQQILARQREREDGDSSPAAGEAADAACESGDT